MKSNFIKKAAAPKKSFHSQKSLLICLAILSYYLSACGGLQTVTQIDCTTQDSSAFVIDGNLGEWQHPLLSPAALRTFNTKPRMMLKIYIYAYVFPIRAFNNGLWV